MPNWCDNVNACPPEAPVEVQLQDGSKLIAWRRWPDTFYNKSTGASIQRPVKWREAK